MIHKAVCLPLYNLCFRRRWKTFYGEICPRRYWSWEIKTVAFIPPSSAQVSMRSTRKKRATLKREGVDEQAKSLYEIISILLTLELFIKGNGDIQILTPTFVTFIMQAASKFMSVSQTQKDNFPSKFPYNFHTTTTISNNLPTFFFSSPLQSLFKY